jgi:hypothetical protein
MPPARLQTLYSTTPLMVFIMRGISIALYRTGRQPVG